MKKNILTLIFGVMIIMLLSYILRGYLIPTDILQYLPSYSQNSWIRPHNFLLADPVFQFEPWRHFSKLLLERGQFPLWNNTNAAGVPLFANLQNGVLYPLNVIYYIFPTRNALWIIPLLKLYFLGVFMYLYLRSICCSKIVSIIGSVTAVSSAFSLTWLLWPHTNVFILFPLLLCITEKIYGEKRPNIKWFCGLSLIYCIAIFGGHPGTIFHVLLFHLLYIFLRFWRKKIFYPPFIFSIIGGFCLAAIQLVPFVEYLFLSSSYHNRVLHSDVILFPFNTIIYNFLPLIFGAPHQQYYKPLNAVFNFQEFVVGYVGLIAFLSGIFGMFIVRKNKIVQIWTILFFLTFLISYKIPPVWYITKLPFLNGIGNNRMLAFGAFGLIVIFSNVLEKIMNIPKKINIKYFYRYLIFSAGFISLLLIVNQIFVHTILKQFSQKLIAYYPFFSGYVIVQITSILLFILIVLFVVTKVNKTRKRVLVFIIVPVFMQTTLLFWNYNSVVSTNQYYPHTPLIKKLMNLPHGKILEVGNPNFPPNINLIYGLENAENDDALEIYSYKTAFDLSFPKKNQWKRVDEVNLSALRKFGVQYIISDYDLSLTKQTINPKHSLLLRPLLKKQSMIFSVIPKYKHLSAIRILTANYNRLNTCSIDVYIQKVSHGEKEKIGNFECKDARDNMYYSIQVNANVLPQEKYKITFASSSSTEENAISLWGENNNPFIQLFFENNTSQYKKIWNEKSVYLFRIQDSSYVDFHGLYKIIGESNTKTTLTTNSPNDSIFEIKRINYPGWNIYIDGKNVKKINSLFISVRIPNGKHEVVLEYQPYSFMLGFFISLVSSIILIMFFLQSAYFKQLFVQKSLMQFRKFRKIITKKNVSFTEHIIAVVISLVVGLLIYYFICTYLLPQSIDLPETSAINWFTVHHHSLMLDYIQFGLFVFCIPTSIITGWVISIWKKNQ